MSATKIKVSYQFVHYGQELDPEDKTLVLDVGMKTVPGIIDHHHPEADVECTASLIAKSPHLVLDHIKREEIQRKEQGPYSLSIITHRFPDFDALSSIFLALKLLEKGAVDSAMEKIAGYAKMVDSALLPKEIDLSSTPYSILRGLGDLLNHREAKKREAIGRPLNFRWYDGNCPFFNYRIIDSPQDESSLSHQAIVETLISFSQNLE